MRDRTVYKRNYQRLRMLCPEYRSKKYKRDSISRYKRIAYKRSVINRYKLLKGCSSCGYKQFPQALEFDHINKKDKLLDVARMLSTNLSLEKIKREIRKCIILCANCNRVKTFNSKDYLTTNNRRTHDRQ
ncbi:MAG: hypothetical protein ACO3UU_06360 [Minisyncoccia bacterium]